MSTSTLFYGKRDAILIDATQLRSDVYRMAADIINMRKNLTHIALPLGSSLWPGCSGRAFPKAKLVAMPSVIRDIVYSSSDKIDTWSIDRFGDDTPASVTFPMPLHEGKLELEGHEILISDNWEGDTLCVRLLFPQSCPDSFLPLPGKPGKIFLNPFGIYDGDPPKE
jgi:hypothetical protein